MVSRPPRTGHSRAWRRGMPRGRPRRMPPTAASHFPVVHPCVPRPLRRARAGGRIAELGKPSAWAPREGDDDAARENAPGSGGGRRGLGAGAVGAGDGPRGGGRVAPRRPRSVLRHLSQRPAADRRAQPRRGRRRRRRSEPRRRRLGTGDRQAADQGDAAAGPPAARCRDLRRGRVPARDGHRPSGGGEPRPGPDQHRPPAEPHRVPQRNPRPPRPRSGRDPAPAGRRDVGHRLRQQRRRAVHLDRAARALPVGGAHHHPPRGRPGAGRTGVRDVRRAPAPAAGRPPERGPAARLAGGRGGSLPLPGRRRVPRQDRAAVELAGLHPRPGQRAPPRRPHRRRAGEALHGRGRGPRPARAGHVHHRGAGRSGVGGVPADGGREPRGPRAGRGGAPHRRRVVRPQRLGARGHPAAAAGGRGAVERRGLSRQRRRRRGWPSAGPTT